MYESEANAFRGSVCVELRALGLDDLANEVDGYSEDDMNEVLTTGCIPVQAARTICKGWTPSSWW